MHPTPSSPEAAGAGAADQEPAEIEVTASGSRRALEELYLELRELAKQHGLEIEYRLSKDKPE